jgi:signal transduction histidine kinase
VTSLRARLFLLWALSLVASIAVGALLLGLYRQSSSAQLDRAQAAVAQACDRIVDRYAYYAAGWAGPEPSAADTAAASEFRADLLAVVQVALAPQPAIAGGIWQQDQGLLAGTLSPDVMLSSAIASLAATVSTDGGITASEVDTGGATILLEACALRGPVTGLAGWTMARIEAAPGQDQLRLGVGVLLGLVLGMTALLSWLVLAWRRRIAAIELALADHAAGELHLAATGEPELDRLVAALNRAGARLAQSHAVADALAARVALSERLAALGRVAAGVAHEIRNPIAAMRLRAENALAGDDARRSAALEAILAQIARLDHLIAELLEMTQRREPTHAPTDIVGLLEACAADHRDGRVAIRVDAATEPVATDAALLRRALDSLVQNAVRHTPDGGEVSLRAVPHGRSLRSEIADTGPGVPPPLRQTLFEPFVTGRPDGTGLGLAIARELVQSLGGTLSLLNSDTGAVFLIELAGDAVAWPPS